MEEMFSAPLSDLERIRERSSIIDYFRSSGMEFPFRAAIFDSIEHYLSDTDPRSQLGMEDNDLKRKVRDVLGADTEYQQLQKGLMSVIELLSVVKGFLEDHKHETGPYDAEKRKMTEILSDGSVAEIFEVNYHKKLSYEKTAEYDRLLRYKFREQIRRLLHHVYILDVYISVAKVASERGFVCATALEQSENRISIEGVYHPQIPNAVANRIDIDAKNNVIFLTGANMAGKSTFMKTFGIAVFLAHVGFPVPASKMTFAVRNGMFTTINLPDNMSMGYSHFYAEVVRVKKVAEAVNRHGHLIVIFDELFRGTNVKDAYDATIAITEAFAANSTCIFIISTHIIEASEVLAECCDNMYFVYLPTIMNGSVASYPYKIANGVTADRHGMMIINNERIIDIINSNRK